MKREIDKFHLMTVFQSVALKGSFTQAANALGMKVSSVSKAVAQLESVLQTRLLHRTTRSQSLTDSGRDYLKTAQHILAEVKTLEARLIEQGNEPSGLLKVTAPTALGQFFIAPKIPQFMRLYPKVNIDLSLTERMTDITQEGFDLAIRTINVAPTSGLYSVALGHHRRKLVASKTYLADVTMPTTPHQLNDLALLNYPTPISYAQWQFSKGQQQVAIAPQASYVCNNYYALYQAALNHAGVANLYQYMGDEDIANGRLIELLPDWSQQQRTLFAIFQQRRDVSPKLDVFIAFIQGLFEQV